MFPVPDPFDTLLSSVVLPLLTYPLPSGLSLFPESDEPPAFTEDPLPPKFPPVFDPLTFPESLLLLEPLPFPDVPLFPEPDELPFLPEPPPFPEPPATPAFFSVFDKLCEALPVIIPLPAS